MITWTGLGVTIEVGDIFTSTDHRHERWHLIELRLDVMGHARARMLSWFGERDWYGMDICARVRDGTWECNAA